MQIKRDFWFLIVLSCWFFLGLTAHAQTMKQCDSLIKKSKEAIQNKEYVKSLEMLTVVRTAAEKNKWNVQLFWAINYTGSNYVGLMEYGEALNYCLEAYNLAIKELTPEYEMIILNNIALTYGYKKEYAKAQEYHIKAYETAKKENYKSIGIYLINLANLENILKHPDQAARYVSEAMPNLKKYWPESIITAKMILAESYLLKGQTQLARENAEHLLSRSKDVKYNNIDVPLKEIIAKSYFLENNFAKAKETALGIIESTSDLTLKRRIFELLSDIAAKSEDLDTALSYKDSIIYTDAKLTSLDNGRLFENTKIKFEMQEYKNQLTAKEENIALERKIIYSAAIILLVIVGICFFMFRQKKLIAERNAHIIALELEKEKKDSQLLENQLKEKEINALLEQEQLKNEIELRNRKLSAKALYLSDRNQLIEDIITSISKKPKLSKDLSLANQIKTLKTHLNAEDEWKDFITHFEELNQGFLHRLKERHPSVTANDIKFIAYIYMNLSIKEIASIFNITDEACRKRKDRITLKMEIPPDTTLYDYVLTL